LFFSLTQLTLPDIIMSCPNVTKIYTYIFYISAQADVEMDETHYGQRPIHFAVEEGEEACLKTQVRFSMLQMFYLM
jgi:hypothetical protein